jgi:SAM-dependent methyltransferase
VRRQVNVLPHRLSRHVGEGDLLPEIGRCPLCGSIFQTPIATLQEAPRVALLKCRQCGAASASRLPSSPALDRYYREEFYQSAATGSHGRRVTFANLRRFARHLLGLHAPRLQSVRILDFGGGDGALGVALALELLAQGAESVQATVVDFQEAGPPAPDPRITLRRFDSLARLPRERYDVVIASAVLEHLPDARDVLPALIERVALSGVFYARTPWVAPFVIAFGRLGLAWDFLYPAHLHDLGKDFWDWFADQACANGEFKVLAARPSPVESSFRDHFFTSLAAHAFKAPWFMLRGRYRFVGGWELMLRRMAES